MDMKLLSNDSKEDENDESNAKQQIQQILDLKPEIIDKVEESLQAPPEKSEVDESTNVKTALANVDVGATSAVADVQEQEEDVPTDFFDDFNNKDFLAGLDVVDAWEDDEALEIKEEPLDSEENETEVDNSNECKTQKLQDIEANSTSKLNNSDFDKSNETMDATDNSNTLPESADKTNKSSAKSRYVIPKRKTKSRSRDRDRVLIDRPVDRERVREREKERERDSERELRERDRFRRHQEEPRRDPDKVKRDIQRDKAKCEKERTIAKLQVVETGLVPPGTEMDIPDSSLQTNSSTTRRVRIEREREAKPSTRAQQAPAYMKRVSLSPPAHQRKRRLSRSHSPVHRRRYSPPALRRRSRSRSPNKLGSRHYEERERNRERERDRERLRKRNRSKSPEHKYLRGADERQSSKHSRDYSPEVRKQSFLEELDEKLSYKQDQSKLQEIQAKLNGGSLLNQSHLINPRPLGIHNPHMHISGHPQHVIMPTGAGMVSVGMSPAPQMVPAPAMQQAYAGGIVYDQNFFVGNAPHPPAQDINPYSSTIYPHVQGAPVSYDPFLISQFYNPNPVMDNGQQQYEAMQKLFHDDNISLTEYLKLTHRSSDNTPQIELNNKVKVLNRSQDSVKLMTELARPNGRFYCNNKVPQSNEKPLELKNQSPMKTVVPVRYQFTTKGRSSDEKPLTPISRLMAKLGIKEKVNCKRSPSETKTSYCDMATQTSEYQCDKCVLRDRKEYANVGVQCETETATFGSQVTEDDFLSTARSALKNILKTQSFSSLTPAQILAGLEERNLDKPKPQPDYGSSRMPAERDNGMERHTDYDRRPSEPMDRHPDYDRRPIDFERRQPVPELDRRNPDFDRRVDWNQRNFPQGPGLTQRLQPNHSQSSYGRGRGNVGPIGGPQDFRGPQNIRQEFLDPPGFGNYNNNPNQMNNNFMNQPRPMEPRNYPNQGPGRRFQ